MRAWVCIWLVLMGLGAGSLFGQVIVEGTVSHNKEGLDEVLIQVMQEGKVIRTVAANKRGRFEVEFLINEAYTLVFQRPYMIPVKIAVDTHVPESVAESNTSVTVPLNMKMYKRFKGMDTRPYGDAIGIIKQGGTGENLFQFVPDTEVLEAVKKVNAESEKRDAAGESPLRDPESLKSRTSMKEEDDSIENTIDWSEAGTGAEVRESDVEKAVVPEAPASEPDEAALSAQRFEKVEAGEMARNEYQREQANRQGQGLAKGDLDQREYISEAKRIRQQQAVMAAEKEQAAVSAHVQRQERMETELLEAASSATTKNVASTSALDMEVISSWFQTMERLWVSRDGLKHTYEKVSYNWLLFEVSYYYHNQDEISESDYSEVRALFE